MHIFNLYILWPKICVGLKTKISDIYIVKLDDGSVQKLETDAFYALHHVNAYQNEQVDIQSYQFWSKIINRSLTLF